MLINGIIPFSVKLLCKLFSFHKNYLSGNFLEGFLIFFKVFIHPLYHYVMAILLNTVVSELVQALNATMILMEKIKVVSMLLLLLPPDLMNKRYPFLRTAVFLEVAVLMAISKRLHVLSQLLKSLPLLNLSDFLLPLTVCFREPQHPTCPFFLFCCCLFPFCLGGGSLPLL